MQWALKSYQKLKISQQSFHWADPVFDHLRRLKPLLNKPDVDSLRHELHQAELGKRVLLHAGDCAEAFEDANESSWNKKIDMYKEFEKTLNQKFNKKPLLIGRIAGQYAKPRSLDFVEIDGRSIRTYRGDNINDQHNINQREPNSNRLVRGYHHSVSTYDYLSKKLPSLFISHEGLILPYEESFTREVEGKFYCLSAHMIWLGQRTRQLDGGHIQYFRGISNPIGIKISSKISPQQFIQIVKTLNPNNQVGKLLVICRAGVDKIESLVRTLIEVKESNRLNFMFVSDPMHGNTFQSPVVKLKTRNISDIQKQLDVMFKSTSVVKLPCGISLQCTSEEVTQCFGDSSVPTQKELQNKLYKSKCDPRLTLSQVKSIINNIPY